MKYTKVNVRQDLYDRLKIMAAADGRSLTNYVEQLLKRHTSVNDLVATDSNTTTEPVKSTNKARGGTEGDSK